ncbi:MAG: recombinase family protein [Phyllobacteriaceae bacterium]|nr:recombinase family protein [Phyllobacteriaceae bacterium]
MKSCFGYIRVSTQKQGEGVSLEAQKDAIAAFASAQGLSVVEWFEEKETAAKSGRPIFNRMLRALRTGRARGLIMHKIDRSARNLKDWAIISELPDAGIDVFIATESYDFRSRGGRLTADIQAVIAADYIRNLREETIKGLTGRLKQGLYPFRAPVGYRDNGRGKPKTICPEKGPLIREAFRLYASGAHSLRSLEAEMKRRGLRNLAGKPLSLHGIETILKNPFYTGLIEIKRTGMIYRGVHETLIDMRTWRAVEDVRAGRAGKKVTRHNHLYRGLFRCGVCGEPMTPELQKGAVYYRCHTPTCPTRTIREDRLDASILARLERLAFREDDAERLRHGFLAWLHSPERQAHLHSLSLRLDKAHDRQQRLTDLLIDGTLDRSDYETRRRSLAIEIATLAEDKRKAEESDLEPKTLERFIELMKSLSCLHILAKPEEKRSLVQNLFSNRAVSGIEVELKPYDWLEDRDFADLSPLVTRIATLLENLAPEHGIEI